MTVVAVDAKMGGRVAAVRLACGLALTLFGTLMLAQPPALDRDQLDKRLDSVDRLIEQSSIARRIEASGDETALKERERARAVYRQAREARDKNDYAAAGRLATEASTLMFAAARLAGKDRASEGQRNVDFDTRLQSTRALLEAQRRIAADKPGSQDGAESVRGVEALLEGALRLKAQGHLARASDALERAYLAAKAAVSTLRRGETLVRSVHFATVEEEYRYELQRNETHMILVKALQKDAPRMDQENRALEGFIDQALELRRQAEGAHRSGEHAGAVKALEASTRELLRGIRSLGIFVPG